MSLLGLEVLAYGEESDLLRACVDCGYVTGCFCDTFVQDGDWMAVTWIPSESWLQVQRTPVCSSCDWRLGACHFCRKVCRVTPPKWQQQQKHEPQPQQDHLYRGRACVDCGQVTSCTLDFCEGLHHGDCKAATWIPSESWAQGQGTPLCQNCEWLFETCHFCRKVCWATPPKWKAHAAVNT